MITRAYDLDGNVMARTHSWVRRKVAKEIVDAVYLAKTSDGGGFLSMAFRDGFKAEESWANFSVLKSKLRTWRSLYGTPLTIEERNVDPVDAGEVSFDNPLLK